MEKHTKGPFEAPGKDGDAWVVCTHKSQGKRRTVAHAYTAADATLFAAAPTTLQALQALIDAIDFEGEKGAVHFNPGGAFELEVLTAARVAIAQSQGEV